MSSWKSKTSGYLYYYQKKYLATNAPTKVRCTSCIPVKIFWIELFSSVNGQVNGWLLLKWTGGDHPLQTTTLIATHHDGLWTAIVFFKRKWSSLDELSLFYNVKRACNFTFHHYNAAVMCENESECFVQSNFIIPYWWLFSCTTPNKLI